MALVADVCPVPPAVIGRTEVEEILPLESVVRIAAEVIGIFNPDLTLKFLSATYFLP